MGLVTFIADVRLLNEPAVRSREDKSRDLVPEIYVVYPDLVFTLSRDPEKYFRPLVKEVNGDHSRLVIVSNNIFYRAVRDSGANEIKFDLDVELNVPLDKILGRVKLSPTPRENDYRSIF